jgi:hypothetical protein
VAINWSDLLGSTVGVVAAVGVAQWTTRRQITADRELLYEERRHAAASRALQEVLNVQALTQEIEHFEWSGFTDHDLRAYRRQREVLEPLERVMAEFGQALPGDLEKQLGRITHQVGSLVSVDWDPDDGYPVSVDIGTHEECRSLRHNSEEATRQLQRLLRVPGSACRCSTCDGADVCCHGERQDLQSKRES